MPLQFPTMADTLKAGGYATHMVGKWHLGYYKSAYLPNNRGFDSFYGYLLGSEDYFRHDREGHLDLRDNLVPDHNQTGVYSTHLFTQKAVHVIKNHQSSQGPMFLYMSYQAVHGPHEVPASYRAQYADIKDDERRTYAGMTTCMDEGIGNLTKALKDAGMWDNTVLVFSSDNGGTAGHGGNNWPLRGKKGTYWEGGMRAVGFVASPLLVHKGYTNKGLVHVTDWYPTFMKLAGIPAKPSLHLDGFDQWNAISNNAHARHELLHNIDILSPRNGKPLFNDTFDTSIKAAIRLGDWKLVTGYGGQRSRYAPPENSALHDELETHSHTDSQNVYLYNIKDDPEERNDMSQNHPQRIRTMLDLLLKYNATAVNPIYPADEHNKNLAYRTGVWGPWYD